YSICLSPEEPSKHSITFSFCEDSPTAVWLPLDFIAIESTEKSKGAWWVGALRLGLDVMGHPECYQEPSVTTSDTESQPLKLRSSFRHPPKQEKRKASHSNMRLPVVCCIPQSRSKSPI
ncbi:hypothetical protein AMTR_s00136p00089480, partial [Amborella trichopoda]